MKGYGKYIVCKKPTQKKMSGTIVLPDSNGLQWLEVVSIGNEADVQVDIDRVLASVSQRTLRQNEYYIIHNDEVVAYE